jgi:hypothetical protein
MKSHNQIERLAYELYGNSGHRKERDLENWLEAERLLKLHERLQEFKKSSFNFEKESHQGSGSSLHKGRVYES